MTHAGLLLLWLLHWLPLPVLGVLGKGLGLLLYLLVRERRHVVQVNLDLCFPQLSVAEKSALARRHFAAIGRYAMELGLWWWASAARIQRLVMVEHGERLEAYRGQPVIIFAPHFVGLDAGGIRLSIDHDIVSMYARAKNQVFDEALRRGRLRFGRTKLVARHEGVKKVLRPLKEGRLFYYLPDMDYGAKEAVFVPFFGIPAATITGLSRLAKLTGAPVIPVITRRCGKHYVASVGEPWADFPTDDPVADARRMNAYLENEIMQSPEQYYWLHRRFKTRPPGGPRFY
jgi:KDO2-lipid IV(A) lauroyltransferase